MNLQQVLELLAEGVSIAKAARSIKKTTTILKFVYLIFGAVVVSLNIANLIKKLNRPKLA